MKLTIKNITDKVQEVVLFNTEYANNMPDGVSISIDSENKTYLDLLNEILQKPKTAKDMVYSTLTEKQNEDEPDIIVGSEDIYGNGWSEKYTITDVMTHMTAVEMNINNDGTTERIKDPTFEVDIDSNFYMRLNAIPGEIISIEFHSFEDIENPMTISQLQGNGPMMDTHEAIRRMHGAPEQIIIVNPEQNQPLDPKLPTVHTTLNLQTGESTTEFIDPEKK